MKKADNPETCTQPSPDRKQRSGAMQERGRIRHEKLQLATIELLSQNTLDDISFLDIASKAEIPTASAYHFYANKTEVYEALGRRFGGELALLFQRPIDENEIGNWQDVLDWAVEAGAEYYADRPAARQILISGTASAKIKLTDRANDVQLGIIIENQINKLFHLPDIPERSALFYRFVEIADLFLSLSVIDHGYITDEMILEAKRAGRAYLRIYLPDILTKRPRPA